MQFLVLLFVLLTAVFFYNHAWRGTLLPWGGVVKAKDLRANQIGQNQIATYVLLVERADGKQSEHVVSSSVYAATNVGENVAKPFFYSKILRAGEGREAAVQLRDLFLFLVALLLFYLTAVFGGSFVAVLFVSLFLYDPRKGRKR